MSEQEHNRAPDDAEGAQESQQSAIDASDELEERLQQALQSALVRLNLASEQDETNGIVEWIRKHPVASVGTVTAVGWAAGLAVRRFNPFRGK
jgi:ElaB/YqjD/DUF883 family membrane-anchored ribosome-binding protein